MCALKGFSSFKLQKGTLTPHVGIMIGGKKTA